MRGHDGRRRRRDARELLQRQRLGDGVEPRSTEDLRDAAAEHPEPPELGDEVARETPGPVDLGGDRADAPLGEVAHRVAQLALGVGQVDVHA